MSYPIAIIDAFTDSAFSGNQAAVCLLDNTAAAASSEWMQSVAAEMNLSETSFLIKRESGDWNLRWFTPIVEITLCGHATLAAAHALWELHGETNRLLVFHTLGGEVSAEKIDTGIRLNFPVTDLQACTETTYQKHLTSAFQLSNVQLPANHIFEAGEDLLVMLDSAEAVESLQPDISQIAKIDRRGLIVTAAGGRNEVDFTSRFFAPNAGIAEDPVTGSAHCALANFWSSRLGKTTMRGYQASKRGGYVGVTLAGDRVLLDGQAVTVMKGELGELACRS